MAEPSAPAALHEGDQAPSSIPGSTHDQAAALSSLDTHGGADSSSNKPSSDSAAALGHAMQNLRVGNADGGEKKNVKVEPGDVALLADQLDVSRAKATELLKASEADPVKAMRAWIAA